MSDPRFPNRPDHPDYWLISQVLVYGDKARDENTVPFEDHVSQIVDLDSLHYAATQQAGMFLQQTGRTSASGDRLLAMIAAAWMTAFQYGARFQALKASEQEASDAAHEPRVGHSLCPASQRCEVHPEHDFWAVPPASRSGSPARIHCEGFQF